MKSGHFFNQIKYPYLTHLPKYDILFNEKIPKILLLRSRMRLGRTLFPLTLFWGILYNQHPNQAREKTLSSIKMQKHYRHLQMT